MGGSLGAALASLDVGTLLFVAICVTVLLGLFLLHAWLQEGNRALAWWSFAYLIGHTGAWVAPGHRGRPRDDCQAAPALDASLRWFGQPLATVSADQTRLAAVNKYILVQALVVA